MTRKILGLAGCVLGLVVACGPDAPPPQTQPQPTAVPEAVPEPEPAPEPEAGAGGAEGAGGAAGEPTVEKPKPSGRPAILMGPSEKIASTFGATPGSVLKLKSSGKGPITLKIPEFALTAGFNIEFKTLKSNPPRKGPVIGDAARIQLNRGDRVRPENVTSHGDPFEIRWPLYDKLSVNLSIGTAAVDDQGGESGKVEWRIIAPKSVDTGFGEAVFELTDLGPVTYFHATSAPPTEAAEPAAP